MTYTSVYEKVILGGLTKEPQDHYYLDVPVGTVSLYFVKRGQPMSQTFYSVSYRRGSMYDPKVFFNNKVKSRESDEENNPALCDTYRL